MLKETKEATISMLEKCPSTELFLVHMFLYSDWIRENTDQNNSIFRHFSRSIYFLLIWLIFFFKADRKKVLKNCYLPSHAITFGQKTFSSIIKLVLRGKHESYLFYYNPILKDHLLFKSNQPRIETDVIEVKKYVSF